MHRSLLAALLATGLAAQGFSDEPLAPKKAFPILKTTDGVELRDVIVTALDQTGVSLSHSDGTGRFSWARISKADQLAMGFDTEKIAADRVAAMQAAEEKEALQKQARAKIAAKRLPELKAQLQSKKLTIQDLAKLLIEARIHTQESYRATAIQLFGKPDAEKKNNAAEGIIWYGRAYNPVTDKSEWLLLTHPPDGVALDPYIRNQLIIENGDSLGLPK